MLTAASGGNRAMRHGWKFNYIVGKVDGNQTKLGGNQTNLDGIPTKHRKCHSFNFHILPMVYALFLRQLGNLLNGVNFDTSLSQAIDLCQI